MSGAQGGRLSSAAVLGEPAPVVDELADVLIEDRPLADVVAHAELCGIPPELARAALARLLAALAVGTIERPR